MLFCSLWPRNWCLTETRGQRLHFPLGHMTSLCSRCCLGCSCKQGWVRGWAVSPIPEVIKTKTANARSRGSIMAPPLRVQGMDHWPKDKSSLDSDGPCILNSDVQRKGQVWPPQPDQPSAVSQSFTFQATFWGWAGHPDSPIRRDIGQVWSLTGNEPPQ